MAGSQKESSTVHPFTDPILAARLEATSQLAGGFSERVAVLDCDFNAIYANESAWSKDAPRLSDNSANCYQAFAHRNDPCGTWLILKVVQAVVGLRVSSEHEQVGLDFSQHNEQAYSHE